MVQARAAFLAAGHYEPLAAALAGVLRSRVPAGSRVLDAGTGTGYYLNRIRRDVECSSVAIDISKFALRRAARSNPGALNLAWDVWRPLPLAAGAFDAVTVVFAPRNPAEFARVLRPGGTLVVVTPLPAHLAEIAAAAGLLGQHEGKQLSLARSLADGFLPGTEDDLVFGLELGPAEVRNAAMMGPAGHHSDPADLAERTAGLPARSHATAAVRISTFLRRPGPAAA
jgi:23S rRNA (guanine745-N1)-methyltransferase